MSSIYKFGLNFLICCLIATTSTASYWFLDRRKPLTSDIIRRMDSITDSLWYRELHNAGLPIQAAVLIATIIVLTVIRRRFFSPISSIPGPFWASITRAWHLRQVASGKQNLKLIEQHDKHGMIPRDPAEGSLPHLFDVLDSPGLRRPGNFVRMAPNEVSVNHPDAVKALLLTTLPKVSRLSGHASAIHAQTSRRR